MKSGAVKSGGVRQCSLKLSESPSEMTCWLPLLLILLLLVLLLLIEVGGSSVGIRVSG